MFFPLPMAHVSLLVIREQAPRAALVMARLGVFEPRTEEEDDEALPEVPAQPCRDRIHLALARQEKILEHFGLEWNTHTSDAIPAEAKEVEAIDQELTAIWAGCSERDERIHRNREETRQLEHLSASLDTFASLDMDLGVLHRPHRFLDLRVGTLPPQHFKRLSDAVSLAGYQLSVFQHAENFLNVLLAGPLEQAQQIRPALDSSGWQVLPVPEELHGHPEESRRELEQRLEALAREREEIERERMQERKRLESRLDRISQSLNEARPFAQLADTLRGRGALVRVTGWVPSRDVERLEDGIAADLGDNALLRTRPPRPEELRQVPSSFDHPRWIKPFLALVQNYGVPRYGEFDPTLLFTLTYVGMFGMMFGDIGHGLCIMLAAPLLRRRAPVVVPFMLLCGLSATLFGWAYGSIFGFEHLITPLWIAPLSDPTYMLEVALYVGIAFILLATLLSIRNHLAAGDRHDALYTGGGLAGLVLYLSLIALAVQVARGEPAWPPALLLVASLAVIMGFSAWENREASLGERILIVIIEAFESVMKFVSGTLSYLRIAAFSLNHVALAIAVFTLAAMLDTTGYWVTVVLGNIFILVLEGAIVMIQALRLEYYEGFSRFFYGDGREFRPLRLRGDNP